MERTCPVCGVNLEEVEIAPITINNSKSQYFSRGSSGPCEKDVTFDVSFPGNDDVTSINICNECYKNNRHLTEEYIENYM